MVVFYQEIITKLKPEFIKYQLYQSFNISCLKRLNIKGRDYFEFDLNNKMFNLKFQALECLILMPGEY